MKLRWRSDADAWHDLRIIDAVDALRTGGLEEIAARVQAGLLPAGAPVVAGRHPLGRGYPDALVAAPVDRRTAVRVMQGDPTALADCLEILEDALDLFRDQLRTGRFT
mgnify:CR=1 FL=1